MTDAEKEAYKLGATHMRDQCVEVCLKQCECIEKAESNPLLAQARMYRWGLAMQQMADIPTEPKEAI